MLHASLRFIAVTSLAVLVARTPATDSDVCVVGDEDCTRGDSLVQQTSSSVKVSMHDKIEDDDHSMHVERKHVRQLPPTPLDLFPPVSTTMKCVISVTVQFFLVWTTLAIVTCLPVFCGPSECLSKTKSILDEACATVKFAPMISILMITTRMRAMMVTNNEPDKYGLPPDWCKNGMVLTASCVGIITVAMMVQHCVSGGSGRECVSAVQYIAMIAMYIGFAIVSAGLYTMDVPKELGESVPMSTTANCVMGLTVYYFLVQVIRQISTTLDMMEADGDKTDTGTTEKKSTFTKAMEAALKALDYAPMVCILFLAARMRSLQLGLDAPQLWARIYFSTTYYSILAFMVLSAVKVFLKAHKATIVCIETFCLVVMYVSIVAVLISIFTIEPADGSPAPPISTTVRCVMMFTAQYFLAYILEFAFEQLYELGIMESRFLVDLFKRTQETVMFAPMLSCLFVATRMQALQMTNNKGAPQGWVQDCMMLTQWALVLQLVLVVIEHCAGGKEGGGCDAIVAVIRNICLFLLHGGVIGVIKGVFEMRETNADGTGQLIPGFVIPGRLSGSTGR